MRSGITTQALRRHWAAMLGPAGTQALAATVISMMLMAAASFDAPGLSGPVRARVRELGLGEIAGVFIGISVYLTILLVGVTLGGAIARQARDLALLRTIGAGPGQVRTSVTLQAVLLAVPMSVVGYLVALPGTAAWLALLRRVGVVPDGVPFTPRLYPLPIALGIVLVTSLIGARFAALRVSRIAPTTALTEVVAGRGRVSVLRVVIGLLLFAGAFVAAVNLATANTASANNGTLFVLLAQCVGVGMIGPVVLRVLAGGVRLVARRGLPRLAVDNVAAGSRAFTGALVPLVLATAFAAIKVVTHTTTAHVTGVSVPADERWIDYSGTAIYWAFAAVAALSTLLPVLLGRGRELAMLQLAGGTRRAVVGVVVLEGLLVATAALVLSAVVAGATLVPFLRGSLGVWMPYVPVPVAVAGVASVGLVVALGMVAPAAVLTRRAPIGVVTAA